MRNLTGKQTVLLILAILISGLKVFGQGSLTGVITDKATKEGLIGASVLIIGTYKGATTDVNGRYTISGIKAGDYSIRVGYVGYKEKIFNGIRIPKEGSITLSTSLEEQTNQLETVEIIGEKPTVDLESGKSEVRISAADIKEMNVRNVQEITAMQAGVSQSPD